jgi:hypothetical protein
VERSRTHSRELTDEFVSDEGRTRLICQEILQAVRDRRSPIVLTERNDHLDKLINQLALEINMLLCCAGVWVKRR